jgi:hypothetical protein
MSREFLGVSHRNVCGSLGYCTGWSKTRVLSNCFCTKLVKVYMELVVATVAEVRGVADRIEVVPCQEL